MRAGGRVGPNAVIRLGEAMIAIAGRPAAERLYAEAGVPELLDAPPAEMIDETVPARLFDVLWRDWPAEHAGRVSREAGRLTADYVYANRIPRIARTVLPVLPRWAASRLLLSAIERSAWTFAGSGACRTGPGLTVTIGANPLAMPGCVWHRAVFARLFERLVAPGTRVEQTACCLDGAPACRFVIHLPGRMRRTR